MEESNSIQMTIVPDDNREGFLFGKLGGLAIPFEQTVYNFANEKASEQYDGGYWEFCELENGGWYMRPEEKTYTVADWSGEEYEINNDAFGIVVCAFAFNHSAIALYEMGDEDNSDMMAKYYRKLKQYYLTLPEARMIYRILD